MEFHFLSIGLVNVYGIGSAIKQGFSLHKTLSMTARGDFDGQGYVSIAKGANTSIVWD